MGRFSRKQGRRLTDRSYCGLMLGPVGDADAFHPIRHDPKLTNQGRDNSAKSLRNAEGRQLPIRLWETVITLLHATGQSYCRRPQLQGHASGSLREPRWA